MLDKIKIKEKEYYSIARFMELFSLKTRKTVYNWVKDGKAEVKKIGSNSFFARL